MSLKDALLAASMVTNNSGGGGGGTGTTNYNALTNKPQIGGEVLSGDKKLGKFGELQDLFDEKSTQAVVLTTSMPTLTMTKGSDSVKVTADTVEVKNGADTVTATKDSVKVADASDSVTATKTQVEVKNGTDITTIKKNEIKATDGTDTMTATPLKVEVKDADETATVAKDSVEVKKGAVTTKIEDDRASMTDGTHTIAMSPVKATYGEHLKLDGDGVLESWEKVLGVGNFAVIEKTTVSKAYAVGSYLLSGGTMYRVTKAIASGGTITATGANANVEAKRVDEVIAELTAKDTAQDTEIAALANSGAKNILDVSRASAATLVVDSVAADGAISFKATPTVGNNQCIGKATLKAGVTYKIVSDVVPTYGRIAAGVNATNMPTASGLYAPNITMISGGQSNVYLLRYNGSIKKSVFKSNADQDVYFWFAPDEGTAAVFTMRIMVCDNAITDDTYVPYAMSNAELTAKKQDAGNYVKCDAFPNGVSVTNMNETGFQFIGTLAETQKKLALNVASNKIRLIKTEDNGATWTDMGVYTADEDTGWQTLTGTPIKYRKKNGFVSVNIGAMSGAYTYNFTKGQWAQLGTLPTGFRPSGGTSNPEIMTIWIRRTSDSTFIPMVCQFASDGIIQVMASETLAASAYNAILGSVSFPV